MAHLNIPKHVAYHKRCLALLPNNFQGTDLNRMSIAFFLINSLDILDSLATTTTEEDRLHWIDWIYKCQLSAGGFRGSTATITDPPSLFDTAHIPETYFALATLLISGDDLKRVRRTEILEGLRKSQYEDGSFAPVLLGDGEKFGEIDVRHVYCAIAVRDILSPVKKEEDIDVAAAIGYIRRCKNYDGGYAQSPQFESHGGSTYCCIASLSLLGALQTEDTEDTKRWLSSLQIKSETSSHGAFSGRVNKPADTCYSFWVGGALNILDGLHYISASSNKVYLLSYTQHPKFGGFGKAENAFPDPLHSCLGLASLSLFGESGLVPFDAALCITKRAKDRLDKAPWRNPS